MVKCPPAFNPESIVTNGEEEIKSQRCWFIGANREESVALFLILFTLTLALSLKGEGIVVNKEGASPPLNSLVKKRKLFFIAPTPPALSLLGRGG
jgi:hypothetical protein